MKIVAISDTHGRLDFKVPACDLLIHAGDICPDFTPGTSWGSAQQLEWLKGKFRNWLDTQPVDNFYFTLGNHDFLNRHSDYGDLGTEVKLDQQVTYHHYERRPSIKDGQELRIWFSPWSNTFGGWAWMLEPEILAVKYQEIPSDTDIIVSHQPPYGYGDEIPKAYLKYNDRGDVHVGSRQLLAAIERVKPSHVICGHIHNGRGEYALPHDDGHITLVHNVAMVNEAYQLVHQPWVIEI